MYIKVNDLRESVDNLKRLVNSYQDNSINLNKNLLESKNYWFGDKSNSFFDKINMENTKVNSNILELNELISIFEYIIYEYSNIGNQVKFDLNKRDYVNNTINNYISYIDDIIRLYESIPYNYLYLIENQKKYFIELRKYLLDVKSKFNIILDNIKHIEDVTSSKLLKYNVEIIKESDIRLFM